MSNSGKIFKEHGNPVKIGLFTDPHRIVTEDTFQALVKAVDAESSIPQDVVKAIESMAPLNEVIDRYWAVYDWNRNHEDKQIPVTGGVEEAMAVVASGEKLDATIASEKAATVVQKVENTKRHWTDGHWLDDHWGNWGGGE